MKLRHNVPDTSSNMTGKVQPEYQAQVDRSTHRLEREYLAQEKRVIAAGARAAKAQRQLDAATGARARRLGAHDLAVAWELVQIRREELDRLARLMSQAPQSAAHRGNASFRPIPPTHGIKF